MESPETRETNTRPKEQHRKYEIPDPRLYGDWSSGSDLPEARRKKRTLACVFAAIKGSFSSDSSVVTTGNL